MHSCVDEHFKYFSRFKDMSFDILVGVNFVTVTADRPLQQLAEAQAYILKQKKRDRVGAARLLSSSVSESIVQATGAK